MTDRLTIERFRDLADAYGGVVARWPEDHRAAASLVAGHPDAAAILHDALALDETLDDWRVASPGRPLSRRIVASAPPPTPVRSSRVRLWWSGIGIAAMLAGAAAGVATVVLVAPSEAGSGASTSFGDVSGRDA